jgi:hypothetical protein
MSLIQYGVMLSIMPGVRLEGQLRSDAISTLRFALVLTAASFLHLLSNFCPCALGGADRAA